MELEEDAVRSSTVLPTPGGGSGGNGMAGIKTRCQWTPRGSLMVYKAVGKDAANYDDDDGGGCGSEISEFVWSGLVWNKHVRKLVNESHGFFMKLQRLATAAGNDKGAEPKEVVKFSQLYRSAVRECVIGLKSELQIAENEEEYTTLNEQIELYSMLETAWHLCEILFIETLPLGCLIQQLLEWVRWHDESTNESYRNVTEAMYPSEEPDYWKVVYALTLQGRTEDIRELLKHWPDCQRNPKLYGSINELLRKMPMVRSVVGRSRAELRSAWYEWKQECKRRRDRGDFSACDELHILCGLLCGDEEAFKDERVMDSCQFWYQLMVGRLLYSSPLVINTDYDLHLTAESCIQLYYRERYPDDIGKFDKILLTALENNVIDVIKISSSILSNWWFVAHLSNTLYHRGALVSHHFEYGSRLTEFIVMEYAMSLFNHPSLWQIAIDYLSHCPTQGRYHMELLIERVPLEYEYKALKVLSVCEQYRMKDQAQSVCRVMARNAYSRGQLGNALTWSVRSKDSAFSAFIAERYFDNYELHGKFKDLAILDNLGDTMLLSKRLTFLGKYREIQVMYAKGDFSAAGDLLVSLLESGTVPTKYWITLLTDALPLLELEDQLVFSASQTYSLMRSLHQVEIEETAGAKGHAHFDVNKEKISLLRLSLARNVQRALLLQ